MDNLKSWKDLEFSRLESVPVFNDFKVQKSDFI